VYQAIADPTRREIIDLLARNRMNMNAISEKFDISRPAISKHMRILIECGLVNVTQEGRERYCQAFPKKLKKVSDWLKYYERFWNQKLDALGDFLVTETKKKKANGGKSKQ